MGTAGNYEIAGNYGNSRGIMQPGIAAAHGTVGAVWSGIGWSGRRPKPGTRRSLICIQDNPVSSFVCNAVGIPFWICAHGFAICTPIPSNLPALKRCFSDVEMQEGGACLFWLAGERWFELGIVEVTLCLEGKAKVRPRRTLDRPGCGSTTSPPSFRTVQFNEPV